jgi:stage II sporulation protein AB (anti-sigma F factor)
VNENFARTVVAGFVSVLDPTIAELTDIKTAVSEAVTNCTVHAYPASPGEIVLDMGIYEDGRLRVAVIDHGCGIPDVAQAMTPLFTTGAIGERSGLGFSVMESFMDSLRVTSKPGKGTRVVMTKQIVSRTR